MCTAAMAVPLVLWLTADSCKKRPHPFCFPFVATLWLTSKCRCRPDAISALRLTIVNSARRLGLLIYSLARLGLCRVLVWLGSDQMIGWGCFHSDEPFLCKFSGYLACKLPLHTAPGLETAWGWEWLTIVDWTSRPGQTLIDFCATPKNRVALWLYRSL